MLGSRLAHSTRWTPIGIALSIAMTGNVAGLWAGYLWPAQPLLFGQAAAVLLPLLGYLPVIVLAVAGGKSGMRSRTLDVFLASLLLCWLVSLVLYRFHGDLYTHVIWVFPLLIVLLWRHPPTLSESRLVLLSFGWSVSVAILGTRLLEMAGVLAPKVQAAFVVRFDERNYWLPLNDLLGIEGRWPGPFSHNGYTAMMGALIIVVAMIVPGRSSWVFVLVGAFSLIVTSSRASLGSIAAAVVVLLMFTSRQPFARSPRWLRVLGGAGGLVLAVVVLYRAEAGLTGRQTFWPAFLELWLTSPITGVGTSGIAVSGGITQQYTHAHNLYIDMLARYGLIGFLAMMAVLISGSLIAIRAALRGQAGPLAVIVAYLVLAITEPRNDWIHPGTLVLLIIMSVMWAASVVQGGAEPTAVAQHGEGDQERGGRYRLAEGQA